MVANVGYLYPLSTDRERRVLGSIGPVEEDFGKQFRREAINGEEMVQPACFYDDLLFVCVDFGLKNSSSTLELR